MEIIKLDEKVISRDMGELEIQGAIVYLMKVSQDYGDCLSYETIDQDSWFSNERLYLDGEGLVAADNNARDIVIQNVYCADGNDTDLFGDAYYADDEEQEAFTIRISN
jgi:hypothetical protein